MKQDRRFGFTLLELLVVVIIVGILASVAIPQFSRMTNKSRRAEARNILAAMMTAELVYYQEQNSFTSVLTELLVTVPPTSSTNFNYTIDAATNASATVTATGRAAANGLNVVGTITRDGVRSFTPVTD